MQDPILKTSASKQFALQGMYLCSLLLSQFKNKNIIGNAFNSVTKDAKVMMKG